MNEDPRRYRGCPETCVVNERTFLCVRDANHDGLHEVKFPGGSYHWATGGRLVPEPM